MIIVLEEGQQVEIHFVEKGKAYQNNVVYHQEAILVRHRGNAIADAGSTVKGEAVPIFTLNLNGMSFKPATISGHKLEILEIDRSMKIEPIEDNPNGYTVTKGDIWYVFDSHTVPQIGDVIVRNPDNPLRSRLMIAEAFDAEREDNEIQ